MTIPCIHISRHDAGIYGWVVVFGGGAIDSDNGDSSISDYLKTASSGLPEDVGVVEVKYRGIHMGSFRKNDIVDYASEVVACIVEKYSELVGSL